ncbi:MAG: hypothetical protein K2P78_12640 [Gemmataceae bacterium]|nr:hypothetical protein [Gemmataceae bacterium]
MATHTESGPQAVIDVTGLPDPVVDDLRRLVDTLRGRLTAPSPAPPGERKPLGGRLAGLGLKVPTLEEFEENRREMWANFPRELPDRTD